MLADESVGEQLTYMSDITTTPRIYVACLAAYNNGQLHGAWIDDCSDADTIHKGIKAMLAASPVNGAEEWAILNYEGFGPYQLSENPDIDKVAELAKGIEEHGLAYAAYCSNLGEVADVDSFREAYHGEFPSLTDYVEQFWADCGDMPKAPANQWWHPSNYTDWERMAHDLQQSGDVWTWEDSGSVHVFSHH